MTKTADNRIVRSSETAPAREGVARRWLRRRREREQAAEIRAWARDVLRMLEGEENKP